MEVQLIVLTSGEKLIGHYELVEDSGRSIVKLTKPFKVKEMVYFEELTDKSAALKREYELKKLRKSTKEALVEAFNTKLSQNGKKLEKSK